MKKSNVVTLYVRWRDKYATANTREAIAQYLATCRMTLKEYALDEGVIDALDQELTESQKEECYFNILADISMRNHGWDIMNLEIED